MLHLTFNPPGLPLPLSLLLVSVVAVTILLFRIINVEHVLAESLPREIFIDYQSDQMTRTRSGGTNNDQMLMMIKVNSRQQEEEEEVCPFCPRLLFTTEYLLCFTVGSETETGRSRSCW